MGEIHFLNTLGGITHLTAIDESVADSGASADGVIVWDNSASEFKYMTLDNLQDEIDTTGSAGFAVGDITGATELASGLASTDELVLSDGGVLKRMDISVIQAYMQSNLTFTTNTNTNQLTTFQLEDNAGTEVTISHAKEVKLIGGTGITTAWTDTSNGSDGDPYDMTISLDIDEITSNASDADSVLTIDGDGTLTAEAKLQFNETNGLVIQTNKGIRINNADDNRNARLYNSGASSYSNIDFWTGNNNTPRKVMSIDHLGKLSLGHDGTNKTFVFPANNTGASAGDVLAFPSSGYELEWVANPDTNTQLSNEQVQDIVGAMFTSNTETRISATYQDGDGTIDLVVDDMTTDTNTQLSNEQVQDIVGAMFTGNTETRISATYQDGDGTIDLVVDDLNTDTQLSSEQVQDIVGAMFTSNTETRISATYQDGDGTIDLVVDDMTADTNTQLSQEQVEDYVAGVVTAGSNVSVTYDDSAGTLTIASTDTNTQLSQEQVEDYVSGLIVGGTNVTATYDDSAGTLTLASTDTNTTYSAGTGLALSSTTFNLDINGLGDIGESLNDSDTIPVYNNSNGLVKKMDVSRFKSWIGDNVSELRIRDARNEGPSTSTEMRPTDFADKSATFTFTDDIASSTNAWDAVMTMKGWSDNYRAWQIFSASDSSSNSVDTEPLYFRTGEADVGTSLTSDDGGWGVRREILTFPGTTPNADGSANQVLRTDGNGALTWQNQTDTTYSAGNGLALSGTTFSINDPVNLSQLTESSDATDDKILLWDESASSWKYMTLDNLQDSIDTTGSGGEANQNAWSTIIVSGQSNVVADSTTDALTFVAGSNVSITTNATNDSVTINATDTNTQLTQEQVQDYVNGVMVAGTNLSKTYNDTANTLTLNVDDSFLINDGDDTTTGSLTAANFLTTGEVGVGTTSPVPKLHVYGNDTGTNTNSDGHTGITIENAGTGDATLSFLETGTQRWMMGLDNSDSDKFKIETGATSLGTGAAFTIATGGDVGINQTSPAALMHIKGSENSWDKHIRLENHDTTDYGAIVYDSQGMKFRTFESADNFYFRDDANTTTFFIGDAADGIGVGTITPTFTSGSGIEVSNATQANLRLTDSNGGSTDFAVQGNDAYILNRHASGKIIIKPGNGDHSIELASNGQVKFNNEYTFPTSDGSANQVLTTDGNGALTFENAGGGSSTDSFMIFGEESDDYLGPASAGNSNGFSFSYGNGAQNTTKSQTGVDFGIPLGCDCTLKGLYIHFGNKNSRTSSTNMSIDIFKNQTQQNDPMTGNASGSGGNSYIVSKTNYNINFSAGDTFNVRVESPTSYSTATQVGPARMVAYFERQ